MFAVTCGICSIDYDVTACVITKELNQKSVLPGYMLHDYTMSQTDPEF